MRHDDAARIIAALFDGVVAVSVTDPRAPQPEVLPSETAHAAKAIPKRQRELSAGRAAARLAMAHLGAAPLAIPPAADRSPIWPMGWQTA